MLARAGAGRGRKVAVLTEPPHVPYCQKDELAGPGPNALDCLQAPDVIRAKPQKKPWKAPKETADQTQMKPGATPEQPWMPRGQQRVGKKPTLLGASRPDCPDGNPWVAK